MRVPTLLLDSVFIAVHIDGSEYEVYDTFVIGCPAMWMHLERSFSIKTNVSTVWAAKKKFVPLSYPYGKTKTDYLAYFNWVLNCPNEEKAPFFDEQFNRQKYYEDNPIIDCYIIIKRR